tara:strand:- start:480 stop:677 length:198 start_codon:yes stop_codon:yes gene_type:complete
MKIYEIVDASEGGEPTYMPTRKEAEQEALSVGFDPNELDKVINEIEFEFSKKGICDLCTYFIHGR